MPAAKKIPNVRMQITISPQELVLLTKWAEFHGKTASEFASLIVGKRLEDAKGLIHELTELGEELITEYTESQDYKD